MNEPTLDSSTAFDSVILSDEDAQYQVEQVIVPGSETLDFQWPSGFDPMSFIHAVSSRIPIVEEGSLHDGASPPFPDQQTASGVLRELPSPSRPSNRGHEEKTVKITWWRPHGHTAIAPGKRSCTMLCLTANDDRYYTRVEANHA